MSEALILTGTTASGKTSLALHLARQKLNKIEIINADSVLVYRGLNIGSAKPSLEEQREIQHHLIDIRDPDQSYTAGDFIKDVEASIAEIQARGNQYLIVGGTGFYLKALLYGMWEGGKPDPKIRAKLDGLSTLELAFLIKQKDPLFAQKIGVSDRYRMIRGLEVIETTGQLPSELERKQKEKAPDPRFHLVVVDRSQEELKQRIAARTQTMIHAGFIAEVESLLKTYPQSKIVRTAVGYSEVCNFLEGRTPEGRKVKEGEEGLADEINLATQQLVKRQRTWFRGEKSAHWFQLDIDKRKVEALFNKIYG